jgi:hypothetical protein
MMRKEEIQGEIMRFAACPDAVFGAAAATVYQTALR